MLLEILGSVASAIGNEVSNKVYQKRYEELKNYADQLSHDRSMSWDKMQSEYGKIAVEAKRNYDTCDDKWLAEKFHGLYRCYSKYISLIDD